MSIQTKCRMLFLDRGPFGGDFASLACPEEAGSVCIRFLFCKLPNIWCAAAEVATIRLERIP